MERGSGAVPTQGFPQGGIGKQLEIRSTLSSDRSEDIH